MTPAVSLLDLGRSGGRAPGWGRGGHMGVPRARAGGGCFTPGVSRDPRLPSLSTPHPRAPLQEPELRLLAGSRRLRRGCRPPERPRAAWAAGGASCEAAGGGLGCGLLRRPSCFSEVQLPLPSHPPQLPPRSLCTHPPPRAPIRCAFLVQTPHPGMVSVCMQVWGAGCGVGTADPASGLLQRFPRRSPAPHPFRPGLAFHGAVKKALFRR